MRYLESAGRAISTDFALGKLALPRHGTLICYVAKMGAQGVLSGAANVSASRVWQRNAGTASDRLIDSLEQIDLVDAGWLHPFPTLLSQFPHRT